jgi:hypothetical protein
MFFGDFSRPARIAATFFFIPIPYLIQLADKPWTIAPFLVLSGILGSLLWDVSVQRSRQQFVAQPVPAE